MAAIELFSTSLYTDANLVAYYRFEGNANASVGNNGTSTSMTYSSGNGYFNQGAGFNGTTSEISFSPTGLPSGNSDRTVMFWWNPTNTSTSGDVLVYGAASNYQLSELRFNSTAGKFTWIQYGETGTAQTTALTAGTWYHIAVTYVGSTKTYTYYRNGVSDGSYAFTNAMNTATSGTAYWGSKTILNATIDGKLDDAAIFSRALSATEISDYYNGTLPVGGNTLGLMGVGK